MQIRFEDSRVLFLLFSALNHNGYNLEGNPAMHPIRLWVRDQLQELPQNPYFQPAVSGWPRANWLGATALCLNEDLTWRYEPKRLWAAISWESPQDIDEAITDWLWQLPTHLVDWAADCRVAQLWPEYVTHLRQAEAPDLRQQVAQLVAQRLTGTPFEVNHNITVLPNYLQSDWSVDPVHIDQHFIILGPLSERLAGGIIHELVHEYFAPLLWPVRESLGQFIQRLAGAEPALRHWGYWHADDANKTVYKVVQECTVLAATALVQGDAPRPWWRERGLDLAYPLFEHFGNHGYFQTPQELLKWLQQT